MRSTYMIMHVQVLFVEMQQASLLSDWWQHQHHDLCSQRKNRLVMATLGEDNF